MVRRFYICGGNNEGDPPVDATEITDSFFDGKDVTGVFKEGFRYFNPGTEWNRSGNTVAVLNGTVFKKDEVIIVEVSPLKTGTVCTDPSLEDCEDEYYLPDIIKCAVARVNSYFESRDTDPFSVHYDKGLYNQVGNDKLKDNSGFLMVWLVMGKDFYEDSAKDSSYSSDATCRIIIATTTDPNYTQQEREDVNFHPKLIPVYKRLMFELQNEPKLENNSKIDHTKRFLPYWGGGDVSAPTQPNLWTVNADCIDINNIQLKKGNVKYCQFFSSFN